MAETLPLGSFLDALSQHLAAMSDAELRAVVMALGRSVAPRDRHAFLDRLGATPAAPTGVADGFWADVELLEEEAATTGGPGWDDAGEWDDGYDGGFDDECLEPHWAPRLVDLLARAGDCFGGDPSGALRAYQRLFAVAAAATEEGWWLWSGDDADRYREAAARYLRACWDQSAPAERPDRLRNGLLEVSAVLTPGDVRLLARRRPAVGHRRPRGAGRVPGLDGGVRADRVRAHARGIGAGGGHGRRLLPPVLPRPAQADRLHGPQSGTWTCADPTATVSPSLSRASSLTTTKLWPAARGCTSMTVPS